MDYGLWLMVRGYEQYLLDTIVRLAWAECLLQRLADKTA